MRESDAALLAEGAARVRLIHGRVIDGLGAPPIEDGYVELAGARIAAVGAMSALPRADEVPAIDVGGCTLMPGLIDCHAHLVYSGFRSLEEVDRSSVESAAIEAVRNARKVLEAGYTTVRDVGTIANVAVAVRDAVAAGKVPGPRIVASGQIISPTGGLGDTLPPHWERKWGGLGVLVDGPEAVRKVVREQIRNGVDNIKLAASGVEVGPYAYTWMTTFSEEEVRVATQEAHRWGRTVAIHAQSYEFGQVRAARRRGYGRARHAPGRGGAGTLQAGLEHPGADPVHALQRARARRDAPAHAQAARGDGGERAALARERARSTRGRHPHRGGRGIPATASRTGRTRASSSISRAPASPRSRPSRRRPGPRRAP